jgi:hypothetical protein
MIALYAAFWSKGANKGQPVAIADDSLKRRKHPANQAQQGRARVANGARVAYASRSSQQ